MSLRRVPGVVLLVAATLALGGCGNHVASADAVHASGWASTTLHAYGMAIVVRHPASWRFIADPGRTAGPVWSLGYVTTEPDRSACINKVLPNGTTEVGCRPPVTLLRPGGVLVRTYGAAFVTASTYPPNATVDGHRVEITSATSADCPSGATGSERLNTVLPIPTATPAGSVWGFMIEICFNQRSVKEDLSKVADDVVRGVRFS